METIAHGQHYWGLARVNLSDLTYDHPAARGHRPVTARNVARLTQIFRLEGCDRLQIDQHCIDGLVDYDALYGDLTGAIAPRAQRLPATVEDIPFLHTTVRCLNGLHRKLAAEEYLDENDRWWTVRIFLDGRSETEHTTTVEEYANELCYNDGEIFRNIRLYNIAGDQEHENRWWARLTETKRKDLKQLLKNGQYSRAFDTLLPWHGLWYPIKLGSLHRLLTMKCDEEMINYLQHIAKSWEQITSLAQDAVDIGTVKALEGLAPAFSQSDSASVRQAMHLKTLFPSIDDEQERCELLRNILATSTLIPSLLTFFESLKYLEPCAKVLRSLLPPRMKRTIRQSLWGSYFQPAELVIEYPEGVIRSALPSSMTVVRSAAYLQLWLFALRHFPELTNSTPRKDSDQGKPLATEPNPLLWQRFGELACALGFATTAAKNLQGSDAVGQLATRISEQCGFEEDVRAQLVGLFGGVRIAGLTSEPSLVGSAIIPFARRYGRPFQTDHVYDKKFLYLACMFSGSSSTGFDVTSFFCKRDMISHFLSIPDISISAQFIADDTQSAAANVSDKPCSQTDTQHVESLRLEAELAAQRGRIDRLRDENTRLRSEVQDLQTRLLTTDAANQAGVEHYRQFEMKCAVTQNDLRNQLAQQEIRQHSMQEALNAEKNVLVAENANLSQQLHVTTEQLKVVNGQLQNVTEQAQNLQQQNELLDGARYDAEVANLNRSHEEQLEIVDLRGRNAGLIELCQEMERNQQAHQMVNAAEETQLICLKAFRPGGDRPKYVEMVFSASQAQHVITAYHLLNPAWIENYMYRLQNLSSGDPVILQKHDLEEWAAYGAELLAEKWKAYGTLLIYDQRDGEATILQQLRDEKKAYAAEISSASKKALASKKENTRKVIGEKRSKPTPEPSSRQQPARSKSGLKQHQARALPASRTALALEAAPNEAGTSGSGGAVTLYTQPAGTAVRTVDPYEVNARTAEEMSLSDDTL
ncbi:hypothetical protein CBER1_11370 [Cercospora berteroae]|uniref:Uncharacterized protein n=1 Tax=Cercospora berteroae TaxID=357750 RepID=A0A2S6CLW2_9PEZI|nr:hypothetical protein CBER1_11370 [Cercospora berteroae]